MACVERFGHGAELLAVAGGLGRRDAEAVRRGAPVRRRSLMATAAEARAPVVPVMCQPAS